MGLFAWLQTKFGAFAASILYFLLQKVGAQVLAWIKTVVAKFRRQKTQEEKQERLEQDVQEGKPRDEKTRKDEEDWLNS